MKDIELEKSFDILMTADDVTIGKTNPKCFRKAVEKLQVFPSEYIVLNMYLIELNLQKQPV